MSNFGNLLTTGSSTPWSPFQSNVNAVLKSNITASSVHTNNLTFYGFNYVTGSNSQQTNEYAKAMGYPPQRYSFQAANRKGWLADLDNGDTYHYLQFDLDQGEGRTEALDSFIINSPTSTAWQVGGYEISASNDNSNWTPLTSSVYYPGGVGFNSVGYDATMIFTNNTLYRYYRTAITDTAGTFGGFNGLIAWDSSLLKNQINILNPNEANVTASFIGTTATDLERFTSSPRDTYGWYFANRIGSVNINWDEPKLFRGLFGMGYSSIALYPGIIQFFKSNTGEINSWELVSTVNVDETQNLGGSFETYFLDIQTPIKTQYLRMVIYTEGSTSINNALLMYNGWMYEMSSSQTPPTPTNVTASAFQNNVGLTWSQNSGSDNRLVDVIYNIERSSDGGSNYDPVITLSGSVIQTAITSSVGIPVETSYVDSNLADGTYLYRIQSQNQHHLATSSFVTTTEVTVPVAGKKIWNTNKGNIMFNPNDTILIEIS